MRRLSTGSYAQVRVTVTDVDNDAISFTEYNWGLFHHGTISPELFVVFAEGLPTKTINV